MKNRMLIVVFLLSFIQLNKAQNQSLLNLGINNDFITVPLTEKSLLSSNTSVNLIYNFSDKLNFKLGFEGSVIKEIQQKKYEDLSGLLVGLGYYLNNKNDFNTELFLSITNAFNNFGSFNNYHSDLGMRFHYKQFYYIGTALRYSNNDLTITTNRNNFNWYWQMGIQIPIFKNMK